MVKKIIASNDYDTEWEIMVVKSGVKFNLCLRGQHSCDVFMTFVDVLVTANGCLDVTISWKIKIFSQS